MLQKKNLLKHFSFPRWPDNWPSDIVIVYYTYDATGRKLRQQVFNSSAVQQKKSDYVGEYFYENDALKFINHKEGRVVATGTSPEYQYFMKDHLGNDEVVDLGARAKQIHGAVPMATQKRTTIAAGSGTTADGAAVTVIGSSENRLRPAQRALLKQGEIEATGPGHAEQTILNYGAQNNVKINNIGASRPICDACHSAIQNAGVVPVTPIKRPIRKIEGDY